MIEDFSFDRQTSWVELQKIIPESKMDFRVLLAVTLLAFLGLAEGQARNSTGRARRVRGRGRNRTTTEAPVNDSEPDLFNAEELATRISNGKNLDICGVKRLFEAEQCTLDSIFIGIPDYVPPSNRKEFRRFCR